MNLRVVYPSQIPCLLVRLKSKKFFPEPGTGPGTAFLHTRPGEAPILSAGGRLISCWIKRILSPLMISANTSKYVFGDTLLGLALSNQSYYPSFSSIHYIKI